MQTHTHAQTHTRMHKHTHGCTNTHRRMHKHIHTRMHKHKHACTHTRMHKHTHTHAYTHTHTHTHTHAHTYTHTDKMCCVKPCPTGTPPTLHSVVAEKVLASPCCSSVVVDDTQPGPLEEGEGGRAHDRQRQEDFGQTRGTGIDTA